MDLLLVESQLEEYLASPGAAATRRGVADLAQTLGWRESEVALALESATRKGKIAGDESGWRLGPAHGPKHAAYSFTESVSAHGNKVRTEILEAAERGVLDSDDPYHTAEASARRFLGLAPDAPLLLISRLRVLEPGSKDNPGAKEKPGAFQRAYLDPARFPAGFADAHDFAKASLIGLYRDAGYDVFSRDTVLKARLTNQYESGVLAQRRFGSYHLSPVIDSEQCLYATGPDKKRFVVEYLRAAYLENWAYDISSRPA